jgi:hypothetical protein
VNLILPVPYVAKTILLKVAVCMSALQIPRHLQGIVIVETVMITNGNVETIGIEGEIIDGMIGIEIGKGMSDVIGIIVGEKVVTTIEISR